MHGMISHFPERKTVSFVVLGALGVTWVFAMVLGPRFSGEEPSAANAVESVAVDVGETMASIEARLGAPKGELAFGSTVTWMYAFASVEFRDGKVVFFQVKSPGEMAREQAQQAVRRKLKLAEDRERLRIAGLQEGASFDEVRAQLGDPLETKDIGERSLWIYDRGAVIFEEGVTVSADMVSERVYRQQRARDVVRAREVALMQTAWAAEEAGRVAAKRAEEETRRREVAARKAKIAAAVSQYGNSPAENRSVGSRGAPALAATPTPSPKHISRPAAVPCPPPSVSRGST